MIEAPYHNIGTFLKAPKKISNNSIAGVVGLPWDGSSSFQTGQRMAPSVVRAKSAMLTDGDHPVFGVDPSRHISDLGDLPLGNDYTRAMEEIANFYETWGRKFPLFAIGGDHSVSLGALTGLKRLCPDHDIGLIVFDAHCDLWDSAFSDRRGHGTWLRNAIDDGILKPSDILQIGVRSSIDRKTQAYMREQSIFQIGVDEVEAGNDIIAHRVREFGVTKKHLYVSVDIDVLDPAYAPGTGTPEAGGISSRSLLRILERIAPAQLIGADVVEILPALDNPSGITSLAGATVLWTLLSNYANRWRFQLSK